MIEKTWRIPGGKCIQMTEKSIHYMRPASSEEALALKEKFGEKAQLLFGGDFHPQLGEKVEILIDLQDTSFDEVESGDRGLKFGGLITLGMMAETLDLTEFSAALSIEFGLNVRNSLSLSNFLANTNGRSPVLCCLLSLDARVVTLKNHSEIPLSQYVMERVQDDPILYLFMDEPMGLAFESVGRTPKDLPLVCVAVANKENGATRVSVGGSEEFLPTFTLHKPGDNGQAEIKAALAGADDAWASKEYRQEVGAVLLSRALQKLHSQAGNQEAK